MNQTFMKEKKVIPLVLSMALPMVLSMAVNSLYNIVDSYFVAKIKADKDGNGRISQEELWYYLGLQKNMPTSTKSELWDILTTGKTGYAQYAEKQK